MSDVLAGWKAPPEYESRPSSVTGITVYAPCPTPEDRELARDYRCPRCGASTGFSVSRSGIACDYCGYSEVVDAERVGVGGAQAEFTLEALALAEKGWGRERKELHCTSCGADLAYGEEDLSATCPFCASNDVRVRPTATEALRPGFVLPFSLEVEAASTAARAWLGRGWMHPRKLGRAARVDAMRGVYLPYWVFQTGINGLWRAEVGTEEQVRYWDSESNRYETRTQVVWKWRDGRVRNNETDVYEPGSEGLPSDLLRGLLPFDVDSMSTYHPDFLAGFGAQGATVGLPEAWAESRRGLRLLSLRKARASIHSRHVRNFTMTADFDDERWRYALAPVWVSAFRYGGESYRVIVNGQTGAVVGRKPVVWFKVWVAILACLSPGLCLGLVGLPLLIIGVGAVLLVIAAGLITLGSMYGARLYSRARAAERG